MRGNIALYAIIFHVCVGLWHLRKYIHGTMTHVLFFYIYTILIVYAKYILYYGLSINCYIFFELFSYRLNFVRIYLLRPTDILSGRAGKEIT